MNTFKKKSLHAAVLAGLGALGAAGTADAVHLNPDGLGQVLIYPYYTTRASGAAQFNTAMSVVNTTNQTKVVKVRYLEGRNSREVLDFNLWLSPNDVWTGGVVATAQGARVITSDNSCVTPSDLFTRAGNLNDFKNFQFAGANNDTGGTSLDRTREGYMEVIEMGVVTDVTLTGFAKHGASGVPANCPALDAYDPGANNTTPAPLPGAYLTPPSGGLAGRGLVIAAETGANYAYDAVAFDAWSNVVAYTATGQVTPRLGQAAPAVSNVFVGAGAVVGSPAVTGTVTATWANGADAFSATIMRNTVMNEFVLDSGTASKTDWVLTFPTKREYVRVGAGAATAPFTNNFNIALNGACDPYGVGVYNREEGLPGTLPTTILPSPLPPVAIIAGSAVCWESTVVPFGTTSLLGSTNTTPLVDSILAFVNGASTTSSSATSSPNGVNGPNGWMLMSFNAPVQGLQPLAATLNNAPIVGTGRHVGLPVIGLSFTNFNRTGVISQYGFTSQAKYTRSIQ
jgi:hypothetical protein